MNKTHLFSLLFIISSLGCNKAKVNQISTAEFILKEGFEIKVVASEPLLNSPVAMTFDSQGRIWVVELPGYMRDINGSDESLPDGKIVILDDQDQDGLMDMRTIFLDSLRTPRALALVYGGLLYTDTPELWWVSIAGDQPGEKELVDSLYVVGGNIEHQPNGLLYNLDNWIYSAKSNARYQRKNGKWVKEVTTFRGQWGISHDDEGRLFYNSNSNPLQCDQLAPNHLIENEYLKIQQGVRATLDKERRMFPAHVTAVNRGYNPGVLASDGRVMRFTSACGPLVYRGNMFEGEYQGNAFVCGPEGNLIKRYNLYETNGFIVAKQAYDSTEFLVSKDESFRPVNLYTGFEGALYVLDLRKGVIQHRAYMSSYLRDQISLRHLDQITGVGRIYKIVSKNKENKEIPDLANLELSALVQLLQDSNGALRDFAQQQLVFSNRKSAQVQIENVALDTKCPLGQIHALRTLEGLDVLTPELLLEVADLTSDTRVFTQIIELAETFVSHDRIWPIIEKSVSLDEPKIELILCHLVGKLDQEMAQKKWLQLASSYQNNKLYAEALVSGVAGKEEVLFAKLMPDQKGSQVAALLQQTIANKNMGESQLPRFREEEFLDGRTKGAQLFNTFCATCHGADGKGIDELAPPLYHSEFVSESAEKLILIALNGMEGPVTVNGKTYEMNLVMPGVKNNPELSDDDLVLILKYIGNAFNVGAPRIQREKVAKIRALTENQETLFTEKSLDLWLEENLEKIKGNDRSD